MFSLHSELSQWLDSVSASIRSIADAQQRQADSLERIAEGLEAERGAQDETREEEIA